MLDLRTHKVHLQWKMTDSLPRAINPGSTNHMGLSIMGVNTMASLESIMASLESIMGSLARLRLSSRADPHTGTASKMAHHHHHHPYSKTSIMTEEVGPMDHIGKFSG